MTVIEFMRAIRETNAGPGDTLEDRATLQNRPVHVRNPAGTPLATWSIKAANVETIRETIRKKVVETKLVVLEPERQTHPNISLKMDGYESPTAAALVGQLEALLKEGAIGKAVEVYVRVDGETTAVAVLEPTAVTKRNARLLAA